MLAAARVTLRMVKSASNVTSKFRSMRRRSKCFMQSMNPIDSTNATRKTTVEQSGTLDGESNETDPQCAVGQLPRRGRRRRERPVVGGELAGTDCPHSRSEC